MRNLSDNPNVVYNIVRHHKTFEDLGTFTLARGLREIRRVQLAKDKREQGGGDAKAKTSTDILPESEEPRDEKARLARSESLASLEISRSGSAGQNDLEAQRNAPSEEDVRTGRPLMSPSVSTDASLPEGQNATSAPSEKARGKMRAGRSMSDDMTGSLERLAASGVGRNGFVPTQEWVSIG